MMVERLLQLLSSWEGEEYETWKLSGGYFWNEGYIFRVELLNFRSVISHVFLATPPILYELIEYKKVTY